ncbi:hypothetical protein D3C76_977740 [compost metagenome]
MPPEHHVRHFPLAFGEQATTEMLERRLHPMLEIVAQALIVIALDLATALQATPAEFADEFAHQRLDGAQQVQLFDAQAIAAETLEEAHGNFRVIARIDNVVAVFRTVGLQVIGLVIVTVEEVVRRNVFQVIEALRQALLHRQAERIKQIATGEIALENRHLVLLGNAALMQQLRRAVLALQADHHRFDGHQLPQRGDQVLQCVRLIDMGECLAHAPMPSMQCPERHRDQRIVVWSAHAPQSSG